MSSLSWQLEVWITPLTVQEQLRPWYVDFSPHPQSLLLTSNMFFNHQIIGESGSCLQQEMSFLMLTFSKAEQKRTVSCRSPPTFSHANFPSKLTDVVFIGLFYLSVMNYLCLEGGGVLIRRRDLFCLHFGSWKSHLHHLNGLLVG
jgi:hypothetical protein